jgi:spermidine/putrescine transport system substrate-binding protein
MEDQMKRLGLLLALGILFLGTTTLAQDATTPTVIDPWVCPDEVLALTNKQLNLMNWATYIAETTIPDFEAACSAKVTVDFFGSNEELLARLRAGNPGYDVIVPSDYTISQMMADELLLPLNRENIPNFVNLDPDLLGLPFDPENAYSIPYQWGTLGVGYNINAVQQILGENTEITSWQQVFDYPQTRVAWADDPRSVMGIGLRLLGYDPNSTDPDEIQAAADFLIENGKNVFRIAADDGQELLARDEADIVIEYNGDIYQVAADCEADSNCTTDYAYVIPEEGSNLWVDNLAIPVGAQNQRLAEAFIDYVLHPQVGADISNYIGYATPNQASLDLGLIDPELAANPIIYPSPEQTETLFAIVAFPDQPEVQQYYNDAWDEVKILIGR